MIVDDVSGKRKTNVQKAKGRKNFKDRLTTTQMFWKCVKRMEAKKRPLNVATNRPLMMGESGRMVVKEDSCQMLKSKTVRRERSEYSSIKNLFGAQPGRA